MRLGTTIICQNYSDWDRYEAAERGEAAELAPAIPDRQIFAKEVLPALHELETAPMELAVA